MTTRSLSSARHSTDTAASDTPLGDRVWGREKREDERGKDEGERD